MYLNIIKANTVITELTNDKVNVLKQLEQTKTELAEAQNVIGNFMVEKEGMDKVIADLKADYEKKLSDMQLVVDTEKASANHKASMIVASIGVEPETVKSLTVPTESDIVGKFNSLSGPSKNTFYQANREVILKALNMV